MKLEDQQIYISTAVEYLEQAKDEVYSIIMDDTVEAEISEFIINIIDEIQEVIDKLDPEKDEDEE